GTGGDGRGGGCGDDHVPHRPSQPLEPPVTLWPLQPKDDLDHYRRGAPDAGEAGGEWRSMLGRDPAEPLPTFEGIPLDVLVEYESPPGTYFDAFPIHIVTDRSLATLARLSPGSDFDVRRFRPNVVVAADEGIEGDFPERAWLRRTLEIGGGELEGTASCPRGGVVAPHPPRPPEDRHRRPPTRRPEHRRVRQRGSPGQTARRSFGHPLLTEGATVLERPEYPPGVPCWIDTAQPDPDAATLFYGGLFGWEFENHMPAGAPGKYFMARLHGRDVAAVGSQPEGGPPMPVGTTVIADAHPHEATGEGT